MKSEEASRHKYFEKAPPPGSPWHTQLTYHVGRLRELTWTQKAFAEKLALQSRPGQTMSSNVKSELFIGMKLSAAAMDDALLNVAPAEICTEFRACLTAFRALLSKLEDRGEDLGNELGCTSFSLLFLSAAIMWASVERTGRETTVVSEEDLFDANTYPLSPQDKSMVRALPHPLFEGIRSFSEQLSTLRKNLMWLTSTIGDRR